MSEVKTRKSFVKKPNAVNVGLTCITFACLVMATFLPDRLYSQSAHSSLRKGDQKYDKKEFSEAEIEYRKAAADGAKSSYNLGNTLMQQQRYPEAVTQFESAASTAKNEKEKADVFHNLGNAHYQMKEYDKSIEAYKKALKSDPNATDSRHNLALAQYQLKKKQQEEKKQQQQQNQQQNSDNSNNQEKKSQSSPEQSQQQQNQEKQENSDQTDASKAEENPQPGQMGKEEAEKLLQIMDDEEKRVQKKMRKGKGQKVPSDKDW